MDFEKTFIEWARSITKPIDFFAGTGGIATDTGRIPGVVPLRDQRQSFIRESTWNQRRWMDEIPRRYVEFDEYVRLMFEGASGDYIVRGV